MTSASIANLRYQRPDSPLGQMQIRDGLHALNVSDEVIDWIFDVFEEQRRDRTALQRALRELEAQLPEEE
jgi:hypothetical protein